MAQLVIGKANKLIGDRNQFAFDIRVCRLTPNLYYKGIGYFLIYVNGVRYGLSHCEAETLVSPYEAMKKRLQFRGGHVAEFSQYPDPKEIALAVWEPGYGEVQKETYAGLPIDRVVEMVHSGHIDWFPCGGSGFDDGSDIIQFDIGDKVRIIGYRVLDIYGTLADITDIQMPADEFYSLLQQAIDNIDLQVHILVEESQKTKD
jgi:hypothetical protein